MPREAIEMGIAATASKSTYAGAGATVVGALLSNEFALVAGVVVAVGGLVVNWYYKRQANLRARRAEERAEREHKARMARLCQGLDHAIITCEQESEVAA